MPEPIAPEPLDPFAWLEDIDSDRALAWVRERNAITQDVLGRQPTYAPIRAELLDVLNAHDRIPAPTRRGPWFYNLWQDAQHPRGVWRRASLEAYRQPEPSWEQVLDLDALALSEGENWVWGHATALAPDYRRCLVALSRGGADAKVVREFDLVDKQFVPGGFALPEAKSSVAWIDEDTIFVGTDVGPGSMTDSGYPRTLQRWRRGTPLADATLVFEGEASDVWVSVHVDHTPGFERTVFTRALDFHHRQSFLWDTGQLVPIDIPRDASLSFLHETLFLQIRSDWQPGGTHFPAGSWLHADAKAYLAGERHLSALFTPTPTRSLASHAFTRDHVLLHVLDNVAGTLEVWKKAGSGFVRCPDDTVALPAAHGTLGVASLHDPRLPDDPLAEHYLLSYTDFLTPDSLYLGRTPGDDAARPPLDLLKQRAAQFDATGMRTEQRFATSADGTAVPYFIVWPPNPRPDGDNPALLYGYGGFEISLEPWYSGSFGRAWHRRGGVLVVANIRGGGEFGPTWHQAAIQQHKQRSYDDFIAVAEDLVRGQVTTPSRLGIMGGSNGGLLVGAAFTQRPELFKAVVCQVPLLDMRRYHRLLAGASWMAEYGNPDDPAAWSVISAYSPYHRVQPGPACPRVLFTTSTRDDRVHPAHARKMAARMLEQGHEPLYYENLEGGHGGAADSEQRAHLQALEFSHLWAQLGPPAAT